MYHSYFYPSLPDAGLNDLTMREMIMGLKVELNITQDGDSWEFKMIAPHATRCVTFKNGDEVDQVSIVGRPVKVQTVDVFSCKYG